MSQSTEGTLDVRRSDGSIDMILLARDLDVTEGELAASVGLSEQEAREVQHRLNVLVELLERVIPWSGDLHSAYDWYCSHPIDGFGGKTAQDLVQAGRSSAIGPYLDRIAAGGYT